MNCMERQVAEQARRMEIACLADGEKAIRESIGARLGELSINGWPRDFTVYDVVIYGEQLSTTNPDFCAGDRIKKRVRIDHIGDTLRAWAKKGRLITSVHSV